MCLDIRHMDLEWSFFKAGHKAAYKTARSLRMMRNSASSPLGRLREINGTGFPPQTLLFGAVAAVLRYIIISRIIAAQGNRLFGLPVVNYFDDYGRPPPAEISVDGWKVSPEVPNFPGNWL